MSKLQVETISHTNNTTAMSIDSSGRMQLPQLPHFHGNRLGLSIEERLANVNYNVVRDNYSGWNSSNHQYTIPVTGVYLFNFHNIGSSNTSTNVQYNKLQFVRSGSSTDIAWAYQSNDSLHEQIAMSATYHLQANDLVQILNSSGTVYSSYYNTFSICFMG